MCNMSVCVDNVGTSFWRMLPPRLVRLTGVSFYLQRRSNPRRRRRRMWPRLSVGILVLCLVTVTVNADLYSTTSIMINWNVLQAFAGRSRREAEVFWNLGFWLIVLKRIRHFMVVCHLVSIVWLPQNVAVMTDCKPRCLLVISSSC